MTPRTRRAARPVLPPDVAAMLDAHVAFEVRRWREDAAAALREEAAAILAWASTVVVADVIQPERAGALARAAAERLVPGPGIDDLVADSLVAAHASVGGDATPVADVVPVDDYDALVDALAGMSGVRDAVLEEVTTSAVYSRLIAHVLYTGIKDYLLTQNVVARRVPGASSLLRLGQSAVSSAAPGLERGIDRQLTSFVAANIADAIRDSREYLRGALDEELVGEVAAEAWRRGAERSVGSAADLVSAESVDEAARAVVRVTRSVRRSDVFLDAVEAAAAALAERTSHRTLGELLAAVGVTSDGLVAGIDLLLPVAESAVETGLVEARVRARLTPFYAAWAGELE